MERSLRPLLSRILIATSIAGACVLSTAACSDDDESPTPSVACDTMCKGAGYTSSNLSEQGHETNCFCQGGTGGQVSDAACTEMCKSVGKPGTTFGTSGAAKNACQCQ